MLVKIKTWRRMKEDYGVDYEHDIGTYPPYYRYMEKHMPKNRVITLEEKDGKYRWKYPDANKYDEYWNFPKEAIEKILTPKDYPQYFI